MISSGVIFSGLSGMCVLMWAFDLRNLDSEKSLTVICPVVLKWFSPQGTSGNYLEPFFSCHNQGLGLLLKSRKQSPRMLLMVRAAQGRPHDREIPHPAISGADVERP